MPKPEALNLVNNSLPGTLQEKLLGQEGALHDAAQPQYHYSQQIRDEKQARQRGKWAWGRGCLFVFLFLVLFSLFFWEGGYKGGGWIWKNWEMNAIGVHDVKPQIINRRHCYF